MDTRLPPKVEICVPPALREEAIQKANDNLHPAWSKGVQRGKHFVIATDSLEDLSELADFARVELEEPDEPLSKVRGLHAKLSLIALIGSLFWSLWVTAIALPWNGGSNHCEDVNPAQRCLKS